MAPSKNTYSPCFLKFSQFPLTLALARMSSVILRVFPDFSIRISPNGITTVPEKCYLPIYLGSIVSIWSSLPSLPQDTPETLSCTHTTPTAPHPCEPVGSMGWAVLKASVANPISSLPTKYSGSGPPKGPCSNLDVGLLQSFNQPRMSYHTNIIWMFCFSGFPTAL